MKSIEDEFQQAVEPLIAGKIAVLSAESKSVIDRMYALWYMRSRFRELEYQEVQLNGIIGGDLSKEQEENLESKGYLFARKNGAMPARQINAVALQIRADHYARDLAISITRWGVIVAQSGEFIVPDVPWHGILPLTPQIALVQSSPDGMITEQNLSQINIALRERSLDYFFASDFSKCPFSP